ncbi:vitamin K epoxide reductase complex subunit 1 isoform X1 [Cryptotermes secundus]|uniref:vitamin K epoxide reductase complex subunit 1 isoform X1 n=1 Tax=Cryptotermes secundus TaxID=105785 RepID=UPI000CD7B0F1|nr:vitamin K epoxide reductase complex subunit 1 isoform X1 [Cryptotermes secundus]
MSFEMLSDVNRGIHLTCFFGMCLSYYAYVVETTKEHDSDYVAMCDISEHVSCSKAFMSAYGKGFGIVRHIFGEDSVLNQPNSLGGMLFYSVLIVLNFMCTLWATKLMLLLAVVSNLASVYLAYILYAVLYDFCIVCVTTYGINFINLLLIIVKVRRLSQHKDCGQWSTVKAADKKRN